MGRPRNPECDECGGPTNKDYEYIAVDNTHCIYYVCRRSRNCGGAIYCVLDDEYF